MKRKVTIAAAILIASCALRGVQITWNNQVVADFVADGYSYRVFISLILANVAFFIIDAAMRLSGKAVRVGMANDQKMILIKRVLGSSIKDINGTTVGQITTVVDKICELKGSIFVTAATALATSIPFCSTIFKLTEHPVTIVILIVCTIITGLIFFFEERLFKFSEKETKAQAKFQSITVDGLNNIKTLKYLCKGYFLLRSAEESQTDAYKYSVNVKKRLFDTLGMAILSVPTIVSVYLFRDNTEIVTFMFMNEWVIYNGLGTIVDVIDLIVRLKANEKIIENLDGTSDSDIKIDMPERFRVHGQFDHGKGSPLFITDVEIKRCERYLITGEKGEGKSSFANVLVGAITNDWLIGPPENLNTYYIYQETELLNDTLRNNITFGDKRISDQEILKLFDELNMVKWYKTLDDGLDTVVGEKGNKLSSGLKQSINLIRAIVEMRRRPNKLYILDEITSNMDDDSRHRAIRLIDRECHSTLVVISHNEGFDKIVDHHIFVKDHKIILNED